MTRILLRRPVPLVSYFAQTQTLNLPPDRIAEIMEFNENEDIPAETLQQYPEIKTFSKVFGDCARA